MRSLSDFIQSEYSKNPEKSILPSRVALTKNIHFALIPFFGKASLQKTEQFGSEVAALVRSRDFIVEMSNRIGKPKEHEDENEFVSRAKAEMAQMLHEKLNT